MTRPAAFPVIALTLALSAPLSHGSEEADPSEGGASPPPKSGIAVESASGSVTEALQGKDGVRIQTLCTHCNSANVQVGGLNQDLVPLLRDGYPIVGGLATSFVLGMLPADAIAEASVAKGPGAAAHPGSAAGGVIHFTGSQPHEVPWLNVFLEKGAFDLQSASLRVAGPIASWISGGAVYGTQTADPVDADRDGWIDVGAVDRDFAEGQVVMTAGRDHTFDLGGSWVRDDALEGRGAFDFFVAQGSGAPAWTREDIFAERSEVRAGWQGRLPEGGSVEVRLLDAGREQSVRSQLTQDASFPAFSEFFERFLIDEEDSWGIARFERAIGVSWMVDAALEYSEQVVSADTIDVTGGPVASTATDYVESWSAFADADWNPSPKWNVQLGLRYDNLEWGAVELGERRSENQLSPRATILYNPAPGWTLKLLGGRTIRAPRPIFTEVCCGQRYQRSFYTRAETGATLGFEGIWQPGPEARISLYAARTEFDDYIPRLVGWSQFYIQTYALANVESAEAETAEVAAQWSPLRWLSLDGSIGWLSFHNTGDEDVPVLVTPPSFAQPQTVIVPIGRIPYRPVRTASLAASFATRGRAVVSLQASYTGTMLIQQYNEDPTAGQNILLDEMRSTSSFWLLNLGFQIPAGRYLDVVGALDNITDSVQDDLGDPTTDYNWGPLTGRAWRLGLRFRLDR